jgi:acetoacetate decarboxylase
MADLPLGLQGQLTKSNFGPFIPSYAPTYPAFDKEPWKWLDIDVVLIDYLTNAEAAAQWLPAECNLLAIPLAPGQSAMKMLWANYRGGTLPPYKEVIQQIPCIYKGELKLYVAQIWVTTDSAMVSGRELGGYPKKLADIGLDWYGDFGTGYLERSYEKPLGSGNRVASYSLKVTGRMVSIPLPAYKKPTFPFPYNLTLPLPEPTGSPQPLPFATICTRVIPDIDRPFALSQLSGMKWTLEKGEMWVADATLSFYPSDADPLSHLPVNQILDAMVFFGDMYAMPEFYENW